ncbi:MAG: hypothetical protein JXB85_10775 [Anaerolineales bacterium]|nr:hypothetical protein [Anaerolineales bacterium]
MRLSVPLFLLGLVLLAGCGSLTPTAAPAPLPIPIDDFEAPATDWQAGVEPQFTDSSATGVALTGTGATQGVQALELAFSLDDRPKAIFYLDAQLDLSQAQFLLFDLYHRGAVSGVGIAVTTGPDSVWVESATLPITAGAPVRLSFDLTAATYKAAATNWEFWATITDLDAVTRLAIIIVPAGDGTASLDNLRLSAAP